MQWQECQEIRWNTGYQRLNLNNSYRFYFHESFVDIRIHSLQLT